MSDEFDMSIKIVCILVDLKFMVVFINVCKLFNCYCQGIFQVKITGTTTKEKCRSNFFVLTKLMSALNMLCQSLWQCDVPSFCLICGFER